MTDVEALKKVCPADMWRRLGFSVQETPNEIRVLGADGHSLYRSSRLKDGNWISSMADAGCRIAPGVGDNFSVVQYLLNCSFRDAVEFLGGTTMADAVRAAPPPPPKKRSPLRRLTKRDVRAREYALRRGLDPATLDAGEAAGFLFFAAGKGTDFAAACVGQGFDENGRLCFANKRLIERQGTYDPAEKYSMRGSDMRYLPFMGNPAGGVIIAEGLFSALSAWEMNERGGGVLMLGGIGNTGFLREDSPARRFLERAPHIVFVADNDPGNMRVAELVENLKRELRRAFPKKRIYVAHPPQSCGDANDWLIGLKTGTVRTSFPRPPEERTFLAP